MMTQNHRVVLAQLGCSAPTRLQGGVSSLNKLLPRSNGAHAMWGSMDLHVSTKCVQEMGMCYTNMMQMGFAVTEELEELEDVAVTILLASAHVIHAIIMGLPINVSIVTPLHPSMNLMARTTSKAKGSSMTSVQDGLSSLLGLIRSVEFATVRMNSGDTHPAQSNPMVHVKPASVPIAMAYSTLKSAAMLVMGMVPASLSQVSVSARIHTLASHASLQTVLMIVVGRAPAIQRLGSVHVSKVRWHTMAPAVSSSHVLLVAMRHMVNAIAMMASASARWVTQEPSASCHHGVPSLPSTLRKLIGGLFGTSLAGLRVPRDSCSMLSKRANVMLCPAWILGAVLLAAKEVHSFIR